MIERRESKRIWAKEKRDGLIIVDCPFCEKEHKHSVLGSYESICLEGRYTITDPLGRTL